MTQLSRDRELDIHLSAIMTRERFTNDPGPVIAELRDTAGPRVDILASTVGQWIGFYESDDVRTLCDGLRTAFADLDLEPGIRLGRERARRPSHGTHDFHR